MNKIRYMLAMWAGVLLGLFSVARPDLIIPMGVLAGFIMGVMLWGEE